MSNIQRQASHKAKQLAIFFNQISEIKDPRCYVRDHPFISIMTITICAMIGGANNDQAIVEFGKLHIDELKKMNTPLSSVKASYYINSAFS